MTLEPQFLVGIALRLGMGKVTVEQLAAFARAVLAAHEPAMLVADLVRLVDDGDLGAEQRAGLEQLAALAQQVQDAWAAIAQLRTDYQAAANLSTEEVVRAAAADLRKFRNPRCQRPECARERARVDELEERLARDNK